MEILTEKGGCELVQCKSDPCIFYKHDKKGNLIALFISYIDDAVIGGPPAMVKKIKDHVSSRVEIVDIGKMDVHLSIHYKLKWDSQGPYFECSMQDYVNKMVQRAEEIIGEPLKDHPTPGYPGKHLIANTGEKINESGYRTLVGKCLYGAIKVLPDCSNAVRDLCTHLANPGVLHWKAIKRLFGYLKYHYRPMKLRAPTELRVTGFWDSDWASDSED